MQHPCSTTFRKGYVQPPFIGYSMYIPCPTPLRGLYAQLWVKPFQSGLMLHHTTPLSEWVACNPHETSPLQKASCNPLSERASHNPSAIPLPEEVLNLALISEEVVCNSHFPGICFQTPLRRDGVYPWANPYQRGCIQLPCNPLFRENCVQLLCKPLS